MRNGVLIIIIAVILILMLVASGCSRDKVQEDLISYINVELPKVSELEGRAVKSFQSVSGENYKSDSELYAVVKDTVIPTYGQFIKRLEMINPETDEVKAAHALYVKAAHVQNDAFIKIAEALEKKDKYIITQANKQLEEARKGISNYKAKIKEIAVKHNVRIAEKWE